MRPGDLVGLDVINEYGEIRRNICMILEMESYPPREAWEERQFSFKVLTEEGKVIRTVRRRFHEVISEHSID